MPYFLISARKLSIKRQFLALSPTITVIVRPFYVPNTPYIDCPIRNALEHDVPEWSKYLLKESSSDRTERPREYKNFPWQYDKPQKSSRHCEATQSHESIPKKRISSHRIKAYPKIMNVFSHLPFPFISRLKIHSVTAKTMTKSGPPSMTTIGKA